MVKSSLTLVIPELDVGRLEEHSDGADTLISLKKLLARANRQIIPHKNYEALLFDLFGLPVFTELPVGAVTGLADGLDTQKGYWLRADPVELRADLSAVYFMGNENLLLSSEETTAIAAQINALFKSDGLTLYTPDNKRWYLSCDFDPKIITQSPSGLWGKDITHYLPKSVGKTPWGKWLTEIQMLLANSAVNQQREKQNKSLINSLWFWGAGRLPAKPIADWWHIWSNDPITQGLSMLSEISYEKTPAALCDCLPKMNKGGNFLAVLEYSDTLEQNWFSPLITALRKRIINELTLYLGGNVIYHINDKNIWYFWKKTLLLR